MLNKNKFKNDKRELVVRKVISEFIGEGFSKKGMLDFYDDDFSFYGNNRCVEGDTLIREEEKKSLMSGLNCSFRFGGKITVEDNFYFISGSVISACTINVSYEGFADQVIEEYSVDDIYMISDKKVMKVPVNNLEDGLKKTLIKNWFFVK